MLRLTADRVSNRDQFDRPIIVANTQHLIWLADELDAMGESLLLLEPAGRNTAPAIALAALQVPPDTILLALPSDHLIADVEGFRSAVAHARSFAADDWIVTFGMEAKHPETGYGYIERGRALGNGVFEVERFVEKPDHATATRFCGSGMHDWNGGIFMFRAGAMIAQFAEHAPDVLEQVRKAVECQTADGAAVRPGAGEFAEARAVSIDVAIIERAKRIATVPVSIGWSDIGSWDALFEACGKSESGNVVNGPALVVNSSSCLVRSDGPVVAVVGATDLIVVCTGDAVLVAKRGETQHVKEVVEELKASGRTDLL